MLIMAMVRSQSEAQKLLQLRLEFNGLQNKQSFCHHYNPLSFYQKLFLLIISGILVLVIWTSPGWWPPSSTSRSTGPSSYSSMTPWTRSDQKLYSKKNVKNMWHPFLLPGCYILGESGRAWAPFQLDLPSHPLPFSYWTNWSPLFIIFVTSIDL